MRSWRCERRSMAKTKTYKLYGTAAASTNALASLIIQRDGYIHALAGSLSFSSSTNGHYAFVELSFTNTAQTVTNDTVGPIFELDAWVASGAAGTLQGTKEKTISGLAIPVKAGDRLYLNTNQSAAALHANFYIHVAE